MNNTILMVGAGSYLPEKILTNDDLAEFVDTDEAWIVQR
ncbi:MAG: 3-oxoacyl-ACP synthase, partial [Alphaproteobacteria bacterium]